MRLTIVKDDGLVIIDGLVMMGIDTSALPSNFHALQWYGDKGEVEYTDPQTGMHQNEPIDDITPYQAFIDAWEEKKLERDNAVVEPVSTVPESITRRQCAMMMFSLQMISGAEAIAMTQSGIPPAAVQAYLDTLPEPQRTMATMDFAAMNYFRENPLLLALMAANNMTEQQVDEFFIAAAAL